MGPLSPVFIVGNARSGTTLMAALLDRHSKISVAPETYFMLIRGIFRAGSRDKRMQNAEITAFLDQGNIRRLRLDKKQYYGRLERTALEPRDVVGAALRQYAFQQGKARGAEKSPVHLRYVREILEMFPDCRIICMVRDGRDVVLSMQKVPSIAKSSGTRKCCHNWNYSSKLAIRFSKEYRKSFMLVKFEDLVSRTEHFVRKVDRFVGAKFEPGQLDHRRVSRVAFKSHMKKADSAIDASRAQSWMTEASPGEIWRMNSIMRPWLVKLGYPGVRSGRRAGLQDAVSHALLDPFFSLSTFGPFRSLYRTFVRGFEPR